MEEENKIKPSEEDISYTTNTPAQSESEELSPAIPQENVATASIENEEEFVKPKKSLFMKILFGVIAFLLLLLRSLSLLLVFFKCFEC
jgi:ATP-dependent Zn protease